MSESAQSAKGYLISSRTMNELLDWNRDWNAKRLIALRPLRTLLFWDGMRLTIRIQSWIAILPYGSWGIRNVSSLPILISLPPVSQPLLLSSGSSIDSPPSFVLFSSSPSYIFFLISFVLFAYFIREFPYKRVSLILRPCLLVKWFIHSRTYLSFAVSFGCARIQRMVSFRLVHWLKNG